MKENKNKKKKKKMKLANIFLKAYEISLEMMQIAYSVEARLFEESEEIGVKDIDGSVGITFFYHAGYVDFAGA